MEIKVTFSASLFESDQPALVSDNEGQIIDCLPLAFNKFLGLFHRGVFGQEVTLNLRFGIDIDHEDQRVIVYDVIAKNADASFLFSSSLSEEEE